MSYISRSRLYALTLFCAGAATLAAPAAAWAKADWNPPRSKPAGNKVWPGCLEYKVTHNDFFDIRNYAWYALRVDMYVSGTVNVSTRWNCPTPPPWWFSDASSWEHQVEVYCPVKGASVTIAKEPSIELSLNKADPVHIAGHNFTPSGDQTFKYSNVKLSVANCVGAFTIKPSTTLKMIGPGYSDNVTTTSRTYSVYP
jgi:hypothetical protein